MIDTKYRHYYQKFCIEPLLEFKLIKKSSPLFITLSALFSGLIAASLIVLNYPFWAIGCLLLSGFLDTLDGSLARASKRSSASGAVLDISSDRLIEFSIILGLFCYDPSRGFLCLLMLGSVLMCITTFLVVGIFISNQSEKGFYYSPGIMERTEAFLFFSLMILFPSYFTYLAIGFTALVFLTAFKRLFAFLFQERLRDGLEKEGH